MGDFTHMLIVWNMYQHLPQKVIQYVCHFAGLIVLTYIQFQSIIGVIIAMTNMRPPSSLNPKYCTQTQTLLWMSAASGNIGVFQIPAAAMWLSQVRLRDTPTTGACPCCSRLLGCIATYICQEDANKLDTTVETVEIMEKTSHFCHPGNTFGLSFGG